MAFQPFKKLAKSSQYGNSKSSDLTIWMLVIAGVLPSKEGVAFTTPISSGTVNGEILSGGNVQLV